MATTNTPTTDQYGHRVPTRAEIEAREWFERDCGDGNHEPTTITFSEGETPRDVFDLKSLTVCKNCPVTIDEVRA